MQFETAEYAGSAPSCTFCKTPIDGVHYLLGPHVVCPTCRELLIAHQQPAGAAALARGALYGSGAALLGSIGWYAVTVATGAEWGIVAIAVGWLVAWAVRQGAGGGRAQQVLAVALTYLAVVGTQLPQIWQPGGEVAAVVTVLLLPVLLALSADVSSVLWFVIVGIALWGAWRRTAGVRLDFTGPFAAPAREGP